MTTGREKTEDILTSIKRSERPIKEKIENIQSATQKPLQETKEKISNVVQSIQKPLQEKIATYSNVFSSDKMTQEPAIGLPIQQGITTQEKTIGSIKNFTSTSKKRRHRMF